MRKLFFVIPAVVMLYSCQKEKSLEIPDPDTVGGGGNTGNGLLTRFVSVAGADSSEINYTYDSNKRLIGYEYADTQGGTRSITLYRNSSGIVTRFTTRGLDISSAGLDSIVTVLNYDASKSRYAYGIASFTAGGLVYRDSTAYTYDGGGKLSNKTDYFKIGPSVYLQFTRSEYSYNGAGNVAVEKYSNYDANASNWNLLVTYSYTYDDKVNPLQLGVEGLIILDDVPSASPNNQASLQYRNADDPTEDFETARTYTYGGTNKPTAGTEVEVSTGGSADLRFYYN